MNSKIILYIPGLNDKRVINRPLIAALPYVWKKFGYTVYVIYMDWNKGKAFDPKLKHITDTIVKLADKKCDLYILGQSAGGSAALNAFAQRKTKVKKAVNICGRLREGKHVFPSLNLAASGNPAFKDSVLQFEHKFEPTLTKKDKQRILVVTPLLDQLVPASTSYLEGATNKTLPIIEHSLGGIFALTLFSKTIRDFLEKSDLV